MSLCLFVSLFLFLCVSPSLRLFVSVSFCLSAVNLFLIRNTRKIKGVGGGVIRGGGYKDGEMWLGVRWGGEGRGDVEVGRWEGWKVRRWGGVKVGRLGRGEVGRWRGELKCYIHMYIQTDIHTYRHTDPLTKRVVEELSLLKIKVMLAIATLENGRTLFFNNFDVNDVNTLLKIYDLKKSTNVFFS